MILAWIIAGFLVLARVMVHYEALRVLDCTVQHLEQLHRPRVVVLVLGCFCAHIIKIVMSAVGLYLSAASLGLGVSLFGRSHPGKIEIACHLPRHYEAGMRAIVTIKEVKKSG